MPDMAMCKGDGCPDKDFCYRVTAMSDGERQSWLAIPPYLADQELDRKCHLYVGNGAAMFAGKWKDDDGSKAE